MVIVFAISVFLLLHSYVLYPFMLYIFARKRNFEYQLYNKNEEVPFMSIVIAAHNEQGVIGQKIESIFNTTYPLNRFEVIVGSDASSDNTSSIIIDKSKLYPNLSLVDFRERMGKVSIINNLIEGCKGEIIVSTDANVMLNPDTLYELVKYFKDSRVGLVDTRMVNTGIKSEGISIQESSYITYEVMIKHYESLLWGTMIGPFGGCYAVRKCLYQKPLDGYLVDDFYISMKVFEQGKACINNIRAQVFEDVSNEIHEEFRRKVRISTGSFQNLKHFRRLLWPPTKPIAFAFLSHKVLRWFGPIFIILMLVSNIILAIQSDLFTYILALQMAFWCIPFFDFALKSFGINVQPLRFTTHFLSMNLALLVGLIKYFKGVKSNVWQPTQRNQ